ncbi:MAG: ABC transporter ATP-binding protein [Bacilli bacterium]|nr:ABC transporter ATP-binding protein [Bacilli bacterium]
MSEAILELKNVTKRFGSVTAVDHVDFTLNKGEIMAILGENGSGKTSLMNIVDGIYFPDEGKVYVNGKEAVIASPLDAFKYHIGMVHQHFKLVDTFSAIDNILLGEKSSFSFKESFKKYKDEYSNSKSGFRRVLAALLFGLKTVSLPFAFLGNALHLNPLRKNRGASIEKIAATYGFEINLNKKIKDMSVSERQTVEIIKALYKGADVLILDEPTAVLTPQEIRRLFKVLKEMKAGGKSIVIITHKLNEVEEISDRVAVMAKGKHIATVITKECDQMKLTEMMVGKKIELNIKRSEVKEPKLRLKVEDLDYVDHKGRHRLKHINFDLYGGEILGVAGIAGSGQKELLESIAGIRKRAVGSCLFYDDGNIVELMHKNPNIIRDMGVHLSFVPEDRLGMGLVGSLDLVDNVMLRSYSKGKGGLLQRKKPERLTEQIIKDFDVKTTSSHQQIGKLSGGNVQKILVGREIASSPRVLMTAYPVRGLDINTSYLIYNILDEQKTKGVGVMLVGEDLDVLLALCDRIIVMNSGHVAGIVDARTTTKEEIGLLMTKSEETPTMTEAEAK